MSDLQRSGDLPKAMVFYHYLYPDKVVSSIHLTDLCVGLAERGWSVVGVAGNRGCRDESEVFPPRVEWNGVTFLHTWRPAFRQASSLGRLANACWLIAAWSLMALHPGKRPDVVIVGTDPVMSLSIAFAWRLFRPRVAIVHWCFDLYPEIAFAAGMSSRAEWFFRLCRDIMSAAYRRCNVIIDIGPCMRALLGKHGSGARQETITPWALKEPALPLPTDHRERSELFGDARLCLLYSGTFGRAHTWHGIPELALALAPEGKIVFSIQGNAAADLRVAVKQSGAPVGFVPFASEDRLESRLSAADVHIVSLREGWTGTVVPSKFFGSLAIGRPVLFIGGEDSAIAQWIVQFKVGWILSAENLPDIAQELLLMSKNQAFKTEMFERCHRVYQEHFSKAQGIDRWDGGLRALRTDSSSGNKR